LVSTAGDNLFIFEGSPTAPSFIWAWKNDGPFDADATSNSTTALPSALTLGVNAMTIETTEDGSDNSRYIGTTNGTPQQLAAAIANPANWEKTEIFPFPGGGNDITNETTGSGFSVIGTNTAPTITSNNTARVLENQTSAINVQATDDNDAEESGLTFNLTGGADQELFTVVSTTGIVTFQNAPDFEVPSDAGTDNNYNLQVTVTDSGGLTAVQNITVTVTDEAENTAPTITSTNMTNVAENQIAAIDVQATDDNDAEGSGLAFNLTGGADQGLFTVASTTGIVIFQNAPDFEVPSDAGTDNNYNIQVTVTDSGGLTAVQNIVIIVTDVSENTAPIVNAGTDQAITLPASSILTGSTNDDGLPNPPAAVTVQWSLVSGPGTANFSDATVATTSVSFSVDGTYILRLTANDSELTTSDEVVIIVDPTPNEAPVLSTIDNQTIDEGMLLTFTVNATDPNDDTLSFTLSNTPTGATLTDNNKGTATFNWTPNFNQAGNYPDVLFTVTDDGVPIQSDFEAITITVGAVNRPPQFDALGSQTIDEGVELSFIVSATDPESDIITLTASNLPTGAVFSDNGDGSGTLT